jgi:hypothetical protein
MPLPTEAHTSVFSTAEVQAHPDRWRGRIQGEPRGVLGRARQARWSPYTLYTGERSDFGNTKRVRAGWPPLLTRDLMLSAPCGNRSCGP